MRDRWLVFTLSPSIYTNRHVKRDCSSDYFGNSWFHVLFHSPIGVLFTFLSNEYLALQVGPCWFTQDSTYPMLVKLLEKTMYLHLYILSLLIFGEAESTDIPYYTAHMTVAVYLALWPQILLRGFGENVGYIETVFYRVLMYNDTPV